MKSYASVGAWGREGGVYAEWAYEGSAACASSPAQMAGLFKMHDSHTSAWSAGSTSDRGGNLVAKPVRYSQLVSFFFSYLEAI